MGQIGLNTGGRLAEPFYYLCLAHAKRDPIKGGLSGTSASDDDGRTGQKDHDDHAANQA
jgi:hypothetical protein